MFTFSFDAITKDDDNLRLPIIFLIISLNKWPFYDGANMSVEWINHVVHSVERGYSFLFYPNGGNAYFFHLSLSFQSVREKKYIYNFLST